jgi:hypothetical protein
MYDGGSNFKKWYYFCTRNSIFDPTEDRFKLIVVHMVTQKGRPHGYEKPPDHVDYSPNFLKLVRVREVPSSNLGTPTERTNVLMDDSFCHP